MRLTCDGCGADLKVGEAHCVLADGHEARYCVDCHDDYAAWVAVCQVEEARLNRMLDLFLDETRAQLPLRFVPQDLPPIQRVAGGQPLVLG